MHAIQTVSGRHHYFQFCHIFNENGPMAVLQQCHQGQMEFYRSSGNKKSNTISDSSNITKRFILEFLNVKRQSLEWRVTNHDSKSWRFLTADQLSSFVK